MKKIAVPDAPTPVAERTMRWHVPISGYVTIRAASPEDAVRIVEQEMYLTHGAIWPSDAPRRVCPTCMRLWLVCPGTCTD